MKQARTKRMLAVLLTLVMVVQAISVCGFTISAAELESPTEVVWEESLHSGEELWTVEPKPSTSPNANYNYNPTAPTLTDGKFSMTEGNAVSFWWSRLPGVKEGGTKTITFDVDIVSTGNNDSLITGDVWKRELCVTLGGHARFLDLRSDGSKNLYLGGANIGAISDYSKYTYSVKIEWTNNSTSDTTAKITISRNGSQIASKSRTISLSAAQYPELSRFISFRCEDGAVQISNFTFDDGGSVSVKGFEACGESGDPFLTTEGEGLWTVEPKPSTSPIFNYAYTPTATTAHGGILHLKEGNSVALQWQKIPGVKAKGKYTLSFDVAITDMGNNNSLISEDVWKRELSVSLGGHIRLADFRSDGGNYIYCAGNGMGQPSGYGEGAYSVEIIFDNSVIPNTVKTTITKGDWSESGTATIDPDAQGYEECSQFIAFRCEDGAVDVSNLNFSAVNYEEPAEELKLTGAYLNLASNIDVLYSANVPAEYENPYMVFEFDGELYTVTDYTVAWDGDFLFAFEGITPQMLGENIKATLYATKNGVEESREKAEYSALTYCKNTLNKSIDAETKAVLSDLLVYAAASQIYMDYKTDALVTEGLALTPSTFEGVAATDKAVLGTADARVSWKGAALRYENTMAMKLCFAADEALTLKITVGDRTETYTSDAWEKDANGNSVVYLRGILASEYGELVTATFYEGDTQVGQYVTYSVNSYVYSMQNAGGVLGALVQATYNYGASAKNYAGESEPNGKKVLLVSIDGLRPDALVKSQYYEELKAMGGYALNAQTINPSITLPAHMSMFHSVTPDIHGIVENYYAMVSDTLGNGITETLTNAGRSSAMFFDYGKLQYLTTEDTVAQTYASSSAASGEEANEASTVTLSNAVIEHLQNAPTDFTFLYYGMPDNMGHSYKWMSEKYMWGIDHVLENLMRVLAAVPEDCVVIITSDHGGGGSNGEKSHGSTHELDMTTPLFIIGDGIEGGKVLNFDVSILDVAPTVVDVLGVRAENYWMGKSLIDVLDESNKVSVNPDTAEQEALAIFNSRDSWGNYTNHGKITSFENTADGLKIGATNNGKTKFVGFQLNKEAVSKLVALDYKYVTFTMDISADSGTIPPFVDVYTYPYHTEFFMTTPDNATDTGMPSEYYYADGREITIDLDALRACLLNGKGLIFIFIAEASWTPTGDAYLTFSNVSFSK